MAIPLGGLMSSNLALLDYDYTSKVDPDECGREWIRCRCNPLYFIYNYVYIEETGGSVKLTKDNLHPKMKRVVKSTFTYHRTVLMASRQLGKSTISASLLAWAMIFYPKNNAIILNMKKIAAYENIDKVRFIIENCPDWMVTNKPVPNTGVKGSLELWNGSSVKAFYPATVHKPNTLARSLTSPILYIDEAAFITAMSEIFGLN